MSGTATGDRRTAGRIPGTGARPGRGRGRRLSGTVHDRLHRPPAQDEARVVHRVRHVRNGVVLSAIAAVATIVYTLVTDSPGRSHPVLLGLAGLVAVGVPGLLLLPLTAMMRDFRGSAMFHLWSLATIVVVLAATRIDGGPASPLDALLLLTLTYTAAACSPYGVVAMGSAMTAGYVLLVELPGLTVRGMFFIAVLCAATMACALASAHSDAARARQSDSVRPSETRASADPLAGIPSRRTFVERLESAAAAAAWGHRAAVCLVELDGFESVDDTTGHAAENAVLRRVHSALSGVLGETDTVARLARCRFAVLADVSGSVSGELLAERLCRAVSGVVGASGAAVGIGLAEVEPGDDVEDLMDRADAAMHRSGTAGRDRLRALPGKVPSTHLPPSAGAGNVCCMARTGSALGTVLRWDDDRNGAILDAEDCPGGCWADASVVVHSTQGGGRLRSGQVVRFDWAEEPVGTWAFRATRVEQREDLQATPGA